MKPKKNPNADLNRRVGLFFSIGLVIVLSLTLVGINYKTIVGDGKFSHSAVDDTLEEDVEEVVMPDAPPPPPPPPPPRPEPTPDIDVVDNKTEVKDEVASTETTKDDQVKEAPKMDEVEEEDIPDEVPFAVIEDKPMFEACKGLPKGKQQDDCFKSNLDKHVKKHFRYPEMAQELGIQGRVYVNFRINKDGTISVVGVRGPDKMLEAEARRIIEKLPALIPGKQRGKPVSVLYSYPILFRLN